MDLLPIVGRELRVRARRALTYWFRFGAALGLVLVWALLVGADRNTPAARLGHSTFVAMAVLIFIFCLMSGLFLTADCLSSEKREGTLGLLFLTRLRSHDVVLGKLAVTSLQSVFGIVGLLPVLALPMMLGGVTGVEFVRVLLALLCTLAVSLAAGLFVSAWAYESRESLSRTLIIIIGLSAGGPLLWWMHSRLWPLLPLNFLLWVSPVFAGLKAFNWGISVAGSSNEFWNSISTLAALALLGTVGACIKLHRSVQSGHILPEGTQQKSAERSGGVRLVDFANPFDWLTARRLTVAKLWKRVFALALPCWLISVVLCIARNPTSGLPFLACVGSLYGLHQFLKILGAIEATRRFTKDTNNGALEILLASPLKVTAIIKGHCDAFRAELSRPVKQLGIVNLILLASVVLFRHRWGIDGRWELLLFSGIIMGGIVMLALDLRDSMNLRILPSAEPSRRSSARYTSRK